MSSTTTIICLMNFQIQWFCWLEKPHFIIIVEIERFIFRFKSKYWLDNRLMCADSSKPFYIPHEHKFFIWQIWKKFSFIKYLKYFNAETTRWNHKKCKTLNESHIYIIFICVMVDWISLLLDNSNKYGEKRNTISTYTEYKIH